MTTYNSDFLRPSQLLLDRMNPFYGESLLNEFGTFDVGMVDPLTTYIDFGLIHSYASGVAVSDDKQFPPSGQAKFESAPVKLKYFSQLIKLNEAQYTALAGGNPKAVGMYEDLAMRNKGRMQADILKWMIGFANTVTAASDPYYDPAWISLLKAKAATGTALDPEDVCNVPGTTEVLTDINMVGTNKSVDFANTVFNYAFSRFEAQRDSDSGVRMMTFDADNGLGDDFLLLSHPSIIRAFQNTHPDNGVQDDVNITYAQQLANLGVRLKATYEIDSAVALTEDSTFEIGIVLNPKQNFKVGISEPLTIEPFREVVTESGISYIQRAYTRLCAYRVPYIVNGSYKKAFWHGQFTYMNDAA